MLVTMNLRLSRRLIGAGLPTAISALSKRLAGISPDSSSVIISFMTLLNHDWSLYEALHIGTRETGSESDITEHVSGAMGMLMKRQARPECPARRNISSKYFIFKLYNRY